MNQSNSDYLLSDLRGQLDDCDTQILMSINNRFSIIRQIGIIKRRHNIPMMQPNRVDFVKEKAKTFGDLHNLNPSMLEAVFTEFIQEACRLEDEIIDETESQIVQESMHHV